MKLVFRADASAAIGSGHIMRCLVLADAAKKLNSARSTFISCDAPGFPDSFITSAGHDLIRLPPFSDSDTDARLCAPHIQSIRPDILIVDHYQLSAAWEQSFTALCPCSLAMDDLAVRPHATRFILDQNLYPDHATLYPDRPSKFLLLGPSFALLREEFQSLPPPPVRSQLKRLLINFGGSDPVNLTDRTLRVLEDVPIPADVVIGAAHPDRDGIDALCRRHPGRWQLHVQTDRMAQLMTAADLAIGAGGTSHWERCATGLPAIVVAIAENQVIPSRELANFQACLFLGPYDTLPEYAIRNAVMNFIEHPASFAAMSRAAKRIVPDALGAQRVLSVLSDSLPSP